LGIIEESDAQVSPRYLTYAKQGEEIVVCDRNLPVAKLVPLSVADTSKEELILVAAGKLRLPQAPLDIHKLPKIRQPTNRNFVSGDQQLSQAAASAGFTVLALSP